MYGKELQTLANSSKGFAKKDRDIIRRFFRSQSQAEDQLLLTRQFRVNSTQTKISTAANLPQTSLLAASSLAEAQRKTSPDLFSAKHSRGKTSDFTPSIAGMDFNRTMPQMRKSVDIGDERQVPPRPIQTSSQMRRQMSHGMLEHRLASADSTPSRAMQAGLKRAGFQAPYRLESRPTSQQKMPLEAGFVSKKSSFMEFSPTTQQRETFIFDKQGDEPESKVDPASMTAYIMNRKKYSKEIHRSVSTSMKRQNDDDDIFVRKLTIQRIKNSFYLPRKTRSYFPEIHIDYKKLKEIQRADAERLKEEQKHVLPPDQELKVAIWRKKIAITNLFNRRMKNELNPEDRKNFYKKLLADYGPAQKKHPKEFAEEIFLFLQQKKDVFVGPIPL